MMIIWTVQWAPFHPLLKNLQKTFWLDLMCWEWPQTQSIWPCTIADFIIWHPPGVWLQRPLSQKRQTGCLGSRSFPAVRLLSPCLSYHLQLPHFPSMFKRREELKGTHSSVETIWAPQILSEKESKIRSKRRESSHWNKQLTIHLECVNLTEEAFWLLCSSSLPRPGVKEQLGKKIVWACLLTALHKQRVVNDA